MENKDRYEFSQKYTEKKEILLRSLEKTEIPKRHISSKPLLTAFVTVSLICATLAITTLAAVEIVENGFFKTSRENDKVVLVIGNSSETEKTPSTENPKDNEEEIQVYYILHRDYMPPVTETDPGSDNTNNKMGNERGARVILDIIDPPEGVNFSGIFDGYVVIEKAELNGHEAVIIDRGEVNEYCRQLLVYFEEEDVTVSCFAGYKVSVEELKKLGEGLWLEETDDFKLSTSTYQDVSQMDFTEYEPDFSRHPRIDELTEIQLGEVAISNDELFDSLEITPTDILVLDGINGLEHDKIKWCSAFHEPDWDNITEYMDENGTFIEYPRSEIIRSDSEDEPDRFGNTVMVKKKLVMVTMKIKNTTNETITRKLNLFQVYLGNEISNKYNYVYNRTPDKYVLPEFPMYFSGRNIYGETDIEEHNSFFSREFAPGEEVLCNFGFLIDEDMLNDVYLKFNGTAMCYMKLFSE